MLYDKIEKFFYKEEDLVNLLKEYQEDFEKVDDYRRMLKEGVIDTPDAANEAMTMLGAIFVSLHQVALISETFKMQKDDEAKNTTKAQKGMIVDITYNPVHNYRRIRNLFKAYRDSCDKMIGICQSKLKYFEKERHVQYDVQED